MISLRNLNLNAHSNLSELCDIDQVCGLSSPRLGTVARFPDSSSYPWAWVLCLVDWHSTARPRSMAEATLTRESRFVSGVWCSSISPFSSVCQAIGRVSPQPLRCPTQHHECWYGYPFVPQTVQDYPSWASTPWANQSPAATQHSNSWQFQAVVGVFTCPNTPFVSPGSTPNSSLPILLTFLSLISRQVVTLSHCPSTPSRASRTLSQP